MSFITTAEHWFARVAHEVKVGAVAVDKYVVAHTQQVDNGIQTGAAIVGAIDPPIAAVAEQLAAGLETVWGKFIAAIHVTDEAAQANGVNVQFDAQTVAAAKDVIRQIEAIKPGSSLPPMSTAPSVSTAK